MEAAKETARPLGSFLLGLRKSIYHNPEYACALQYKQAQLLPGLD